MFNIMDFLFGTHAEKLVLRKTERVEKALRYEDKSKRTRIIS